MLDVIEFDKKKAEVRMQVRTPFTYCDNWDPLHVGTGPLAAIREEQKKKEKKRKGKTGRHLIITNKSGLVVFTAGDEGR